MKKNSFKNRMKAAAASVAMLTASILPAFSPVQASAELTEMDNFARLLQHSMYFYDANMCGTEVEENTRLSWRGDCHTYDAAVPLHPIDAKNIGVNLSEDFIEKYKDILDPDGDGCVDVAGGFHDAGDHVEFGMPENYSAATLGWGYYEFRDSYQTTGQADHIETLLRYFNDYLMKCTFRDKDGTVIAHCYQVGDGDIDHSYWQSPEVDSMARPAFFLTADKPQTDYVASAAASLAINYLNFKDTDAEYAEKSLDYALALFDFAMTNEKQLSDNGDGPKAYYNSSKWEDDYCWAAAWLYKITGDEKYLKEIYPNYDYYAAPCYVYCWNDMWGGVQCILGEISMDKPYKEGEHVYPNFIDDFKVAAGKSPYEEMNCWSSVAEAMEKYMTGGVGTITPQGYFWLNTWGSARYNTAAQLIGLVYDKYNNNMQPSKYSNWAKKQMEYIMGDNDIEYSELGDGSHGNRCFVVGFNENSCAYPHHRAASGLTKCEDPAPQRHVLYGALVGGPDANDKHNDITSDWIYNEVTIDYNAAFVGASAGLYAFFGSPDDPIDADFPPAEASNGEDGASSNGYWIEAFAVDDLHDDGAGVTKVSFMVRTDSNKPSDKVSVRYYFDSSEISNISSVKASELYDQSSTEAGEEGADGIISGPFKYDGKENTYYVEVSWDGYKIANSGKKYQFSMGMYYGDNWDPTNDWSYQGLPSLTDSEMFGNNNEIKTDYICVYDDGVLVGGIEPDGSVPTEAEPVTTEKTTEAGTKTEDSTSVVLGDVDENASIDILDVIILNKALLGKENLSASQEKNADVNKSGKPDSSDALMIMKAIVGLLTLE
ncbi:MAG: glycoside hydrolase family 9 protein [Oscillospiraceae bacterium]|nr:glycoside hydrolase family 9 protein [Oscillospiraceae bacterium]